MMINAASVLITCVGLICFGHLIGLGLLLRNQRWLAWPPNKRQRSSGNATVSVIVPARNEATDIAQCLKSLLAQDYPNLRVIVVNDHSDDDTPRIIDEIAAADSRLIVIHNPPLQPGWLGKQNAMHAAMQHVDSELILLTDADVEFNPACLSLTVGELERERLDLLSVYPTFEFVSFCETMLLPFYVGGAAILLSPAIEDPRSRHAMAVGAFILLRSERLQQVGGFEAIKTDILDDVVMAQRFKKHGFPIGLRAAPDLLRLRFFKGNRHAFFGVTKHLLGSVQDFIWMAPLLALIPLLMYGTLLCGVVYDSGTLNRYDGLPVRRRRPLRRTGSPSYPKNQLSRSSWTSVKSPDSLMRNRLIHQNSHQYSSAERKPDRRSICRSRIHGTSTGAHGHTHERERTGAQWSQLRQSEAATGVSWFPPGEN